MVVRGLEPTRSPTSSIDRTCRDNPCCRNAANLPEHHQRTALGQSVANQPTDSGDVLRFPSARNLGQKESSHLAITHSCFSLCAINTLLFVSFQAVCAAIASLASPKLDAPQHLLLREIGAPNQTRPTNHPPCRTVTRYRLRLRFTDYRSQATQPT